MRKIGILKVYWRMFLYGQFIKINFLGNKNISSFLARKYTRLHIGSTDAVFDPEFVGPQLASKWSATISVEG